MQALAKLWKSGAKARPAIAPNSERELSVSLRSLEDWQRAVAAYPFIFEQGHIEEIVRRAKTAGVYSKFFREHIPPADVSVQGTNYRESLLARGLNSRLRAVLDLLAEERGIENYWTYSIYAPEALTPFALLLRGKFAKYYGSEYAGTKEQRAALFPTPIEDLMRLSFEDGVFDCVITNEVFEHIPDLQAGLHEIHRILKPSGVMISTCPFGYNGYETAIKARLTAGSIEYLAEPEYHGNPVDPEGGSLVFQIPGWSILDDCRRIGFTDVEMVFVSSPERGITGAECAGVHVLRCRKS